VKSQGSYSILVVDDDMVTRQTFMKIFETEGYEVVLAENGLEAIQWIEKRPFSMVVLDVEMPNVNGFEVLKAIRKHYSSSCRPVIMISAYDSQDHILKAFDVGANDYVTKPIDIKLVLARIRAHITATQQHPL